VFWLASNQYRPGTELKDLVCNASQQESAQVGDSARSHHHHVGLVLVSGIQDRLRHPARQPPTNCSPGWYAGSLDLALQALYEPVRGAERPK
jgi:hypothetical protein